MQNPGFQETQTAYAAEDPRTLIGQVRRLGQAGPAYEIMSLDDDGNLVLEVICSGEKVVCPVAEVLEDPIAETFP